ncbi:MAG TPA: ATP-binding protein [Myxococcales bacterium]|nr:ATP-binding protein [Myxococcales bacterium]
MARSLTARVATFSFGVELAFACAIPVAYLRLFDIEDGGDRAIVLGMVAALYLARTGALAAYLARLLRPIERWMGASPEERRDAGLTARAAGAAYDVPLVFSVVWAVTWLLFYLPVTALLRSQFAERIPLTGRAPAATILFGVACFSAALPLAYSLLTRLLGPIAGRLSLAARELGVALPGRRVSLRIRLVILSLSLIAAPTVWLSLTSYMSQVWTRQRDLAARAGQLAETLAQSAPGSQDGPSRELAARALSTPVDVVAVAGADGSVPSGSEADRELAAAPGLRFRLVRALSRRSGEEVFDPSAERAASYRAIPGTGTLALAISRAPRRDHRGELVDLLFFALVAGSWAPVCAVFLAGSIAAPLQRVRSVVSQIVGRDEVDRVDRIPVFYRDEIGDLAQGANEMIDRLRVSSESIRRYAADREQLLAAAARHAAELDAVLDNMVEGVFACDRSGGMTLTNAAGRRLLDLVPAAGAKGQPGKAARAQPPDGRVFRPAELPLVRALSGEVIVEEDEVLENPATHRPVFLRSSAAPIRDSRGAIAGAVVVARDVTEVVDLERLKDQFIRVAAHELKTPAAILKGYALTLMRTDERLSPPSRRMLEAIDRGADRLNRIVEDLVDVSQAFLDVLQLSPSPVGLRELVRETVAEVPVTDLHRIVVRDREGPLTVSADPARTRQALRILLDNAIKYSPAGGTIEVAVDADSERVRVSVRDCGVGIPTQGQDHIFRLFYRAHTDTPHDYGGMGIGLYMAREIIKRQGGRIWFESREGEGSTFFFTLPLARQVAAS